MTHTALTVAGCCLGEISFTDVCCSKLGPWIAKRRTAEVQKKYSEIGGGSPILQWTNKQGELLCEKLDKISPETSPHKYYVAFRYADPLTEDTLERIRKYGYRIFLGVMQRKHVRRTNGALYEIIGIDRAFFSFSVTEYGTLYFFPSTRSIVARLRAPVLTLYTIITGPGDYIPFAFHLYYKNRFIQNLEYVSHLLYEIYLS